MSLFDLFKTKKVEPPKPTLQIKIPVQTMEFSIYPDNENLLNKIVKQGIKLEDIDPYDGMTASDIKELDERVYQVNNEDADVRLELSNDVVNFYITDYENNEYLMTTMPLNKKLKFYFENKDKLRLSQDAYFRGGKYKQPYNGTVESDETPLFIWIDIAFFDDRGE